MAGQRRRRGGAGTSAVVTYLSLFMLLLVFFVVLTAHSQWRPHRTAAVLRGVDEQFGGGEVPPAVADGRVGTGAWQTARATLGALGDLVRRELAVAKVAQENSGDLQMVEVPIEAMFVPGSAVIRPERVGLLHRIARVLREPPPGVRFQASVMMALSGPVRSGPTSPERAAAVGEALVAGGAPAAAVAVGLEAGRPDMIRVLFGIDVEDGEPARGP